MYHEKHLCNFFFLRNSAKNDIFQSMKEKYINPFSFDIGN